MGLDNGICIVYDISNADSKNIPNCRIPYVLYERSNYMSVEYFPNAIHLQSEVLYWRKWWGVRNAVMRQLSNSGEEYQIPLTIEDCYMIIETLHEFDDKEIWISEGNSIWDYEEHNIHDHILRDIQTLKDLIVLMKNNDPRVKEIYFYDSY